jgi:hypothetical protein
MGIKRKGDVFLEAIEACFDKSSGDGQDISWAPALILLGIQAWIMSLNS